MRNPVSVAIAALWLAACSSPPPAPQPEGKAALPPEPVKIATFYSAQPVVSLDAPATLCYGVENAASVRLTPPVEALWPALSRCFTVNPRTATRFTLTAIGKDGRQVTRDLELKIGRASPGAATSPRAGDPEILFFLAPSPEIPAGFPATLCYGVAGAASVSMTPDVGPLRPSDRFCATVKPDKTTTYTLTATAASGRAVRQDLTVTVK